MKIHEFIDNNKRLNKLILIFGNKNKQFVFRWMKERNNLIYEDVRINMIQDFYKPKTKQKKMRKIVTNRKDTPYHTTYCIQIVLH